MQRYLMPATGVYEKVKLTSWSTDYPSEQVIEYMSYWLSISIILNLKYILGQIIFVSGGSKERRNGALNVVDFHISLWFTNIESHHSDPRGLLTTSPIWSGVGVFLVRIMIFSPIAWMFIILINIDMFYWRIFLTMFLSLRDVMTWILLNFPVRCWLDISSMNCGTVVGYFLPIMRIHTLVLFISGKERLQGILFVDWDI